MNRIIFPLKFGMKYKAVGNLQDGLQRLSDAKILKLPGDQKKIAEARALERSKQYFGSIIGQM